MLILRENNCFVEYIKYYVEPFQVFDCVNLLNSMCLVIWFLLKSIVDIFVVSWFWKGEQFKCKGSIFRIYCSLILFEIIFDRSLIEFKWKDKFFNEEFVEIFGFQRWLIPYFNIKRLRNYKFRKLTQNGSNKIQIPFPQIKFKAKGFPSEILKSSYNKNRLWSLWNFSPQSN